MINIIVAVGQGGVIGYQNRLLWHISEDLKHFKSLTMGHPIIMGRKTFESLGRALPARPNIVVSHQSDMKLPGVEVVGSIEQALELCQDQEQIFIIGGGEIYRQTLPMADKIYMTKVEQNHEGDTFFPELSPEQWVQTENQAHDGFTFVEYSRR
ncbi:MAG: dihydrofolate reductase [Mucinivorans sp.]